MARERNTVSTLSFCSSDSVSHASRMRSRLSSRAKISPVDRVADILGHRDGYNGQLQRWKLGRRVIATWNGYPLVLPVDVPGTPNLTWTVTKPVTARPP